MPLLSTACQRPVTSYLQLLPPELSTEVMNGILSARSLWQEEDQDDHVSRVEQALRFSMLSQEVYGRSLHPMIIIRMRADLAHAKKDILEPYYPDYDSKQNLFDAFFSYGASVVRSKLREKDPFSQENPKMFQMLLPFKGILSYYALDSAWVKEFLNTKNCGGTLRKHIFINAMKYRHEELVNYLWNSRYRKKAIMFQTRDRSFVRMAAAVAKHARYEGIHHELRQVEEKIKARIKASQVYYPG